MCELFAMSSFLPSTVTFSLEEFSQHGGLTDSHKDGWGIAFYEENDVRMIKEPQAAVYSPCLEFVKAHNFRSKIIISHIRKATQGEKTLRNTQPFCRELRGNMHTFVHNGDLIQLASNPKVRLDNYFPLGNTDSEYAFCFLMNLMGEIWKADFPPGIEERYEVISYFANIIRDLGPANFIYSDSELIFVHGHKRTQKGGKGIHPPGLFSLCRTCYARKHHQEVEGLQIGPQGDQQKIVLVASVPLTNEPWIPLAENEILILKKGEILKI